MKHLAAAIVAAFSFFGCASPRQPAAPPAPKIVQCEQNPRSFVTDAKGAISMAVYDCYRDDGVVVVQFQKLTPEQIKAVTATIAPQPAPAAAKIPAEVKLADACAELSGWAYTKCRIAQKTSKAPGEGLKAVK